jgi:hypothetical protein
MAAAAVSIAIATTRITVERPARPATEDPYGEGYDDPADRDDTKALVIDGHRATISPAGAGIVGNTSGGESEVMQYRLTCDPCPMSYLDVVTDERTGQEFEVLWAIESPGVAGLGHVAAGLRTIKGRSL